MANGGMNYRRAWPPGGTWFFTISLLQREGVYPADWAGPMEEVGAEHEIVRRNTPRLLRLTRAKLLAGR